jgi:hypothetical protein
MAIENLKKSLDFSTFNFQYNLFGYIYIYSQQEKALSLITLPSADRSGVITSVNLCDR